MNRFALFPLAALALAGITAPVIAASKVGVVDIVEVMNNYERTKDASADLQVEQANLKAASEPRIKKIEELRLQRDGFNKGTEEWQRLDEQALQAEMGLRTWLAVEQAKIERRHTEVLLDMYQDILKIVAEEAKVRGLDLVLTKAFLQPPQIQLDLAGGLEDLKQRIVAQRLLYPTDVEDITSEVLKKLNVQYKATQREPEATPKG